MLTKHCWVLLDIAYLKSYKIVKHCSIANKKVAKIFSLILSIEFYQKLPMNETFTNTFCVAMVTSSYFISLNFDFK